MKLIFFFFVCQKVELNGDNSRKHANAEIVNSVEFIFRFMSSHGDQRQKNSFLYVDIDNENEQTEGILLRTDDN